MRKPLFVVLAVLTLAGCGPERPRLPSLPAAFSTIPLPPQAEYLGQSGSEDALMFTFRSVISADSVAASYRRMFAADSLYTSLNATRGAEGEHAFYVEYRARPIWVRIRPEAGSPGSIIELTGAVVRGSDSAARAETSPARDTVIH
jgi:hypothetical protein